MNDTKTHKYHILTFGCQMNKSDSERLSTVLESMKMGAIDEPSEADVILMNSCSVRESAENRVYGKARTFAKLKKKNPKLIIGVTGCMPGRDKKGKMGAKLDGVDLYFPIKDMTLLPQKLAELNPDLRNMLDIEDDYLKLNPNYDNKFQAFVTIQTGCNMFCTYCVVPYARGLEVNRPVVDILGEVRGLVMRGCIEITLLGQIVNHYIAPDPENFSISNPYKKNNFAMLLWEMNQIEELDRIHFTAPHPLYMDDEAIDALTLPKQLNFIHLPVQAGSTEVLTRMNRRHDRELYLDVIDKIRIKMPDIAIGTDIIVGFSGETEEHFEETYSLYEKCDFDIAYTAKYSERSGTLGTKIYHDDVSLEEKKRRWERLQELMEATTLRKNQLFLDKTVSVLVDNYEGGWCTGNSREMKRVRFKGDESMVGTVQQINIIRPSTWMLFGKIDEGVSDAEYKTT